MDGDSLQDRRYAPPAAHVADVDLPATDAGQLATRTRRFWALMLDVGLAVAVLLLLEAVLPVAPWESEADAGWWTLQPMTAGIDLAIFLLLNAVLLVQRGQTIGKALLKIRIVRSDGGKASAFQLLAVRYGLFHLTMILPAIGVAVGVVDALLIFRQPRRCLHDIVAGTIVVNA